jgi:phospholipase C
LPLESLFEPNANHFLKAERGYQRMKIHVSSTIACCAIIISTQVSAAAGQQSHAPANHSQTAISSSGQLPPWVSRLFWKRLHGHNQELIPHSPIRNIVVIDMENRTVDNLFSGYYGVPWSQAQGDVWQNHIHIANPATANLTQIGLEFGGSPEHYHDGFVSEYNGGGNPWNPV